MAKKVYNINAIRPLLVVNHNEGNKKAISKDMVLGAEIDISYFNEWVKDVNALYATVVEYVTLKHNLWVKGSKVEEGAVVAAYERIFPKWKQVLSCGEANKHTKELHVTERDVEDLVGFAWQFLATKNGTVIAPVADNKFRNKVEALIGCAIAKNAVLTDEERDILESYYSAQKRIQSCIDRVSEYETSKKQWRMMKRSDTSADFVSFIDGQIAVIDKDIEATNELKNKAEQTVNELSARAVAIESKIAKAI